MAMEIDSTEEQLLSVVEVGLGVTFGWLEPASTRLHPPSTAMAFHRQNMIHPSRELVTGLLVRNGTHSKEMQ